MRKALFIFVALLAMAGGLNAQDYRGTGDDSQSLYVSPVYAVPGPGDWFYMMPLSDQMSMIYGSRYRKANSNVLWGMTLTSLIAPSCALIGLSGLAVAAAGDIDSGPYGALIGVSGLIGTVASLGIGIPIWIKGRHDLDVMMDDYSRRYAPRPNLTMGPTQNGVGLALNF